jgi:hypothetical protein
MYRSLTVIVMFVLLSGCTSNTSPPQIPQFTFSQNSMDSDGYYKYSTYWFKGQLKDSVPHGKGKCRTLYLTALDKKEWLNGLCEFNNGVRIDHLHQQRQDQSLAFTNQERRNELSNEREQQVREEQRRQQAAARRQANEQMWANAALQGLNTLNSGLQQAEIERERFDTHIADTLYDAQQQRKRDERTHQLENIKSNTASLETKQDREHVLKKEAVEKQRLQQEEQVRKEAEQKQQVLAQKQEDEKRQKELAQKKQQELKKAAAAQKKQELADYSSAIRANTRVGAISCGGNQRIHIVGVLGRAPRPSHVYNDCKLQEVRYRCPSQTNWQYRSNDLWVLNNSCIGVGDDVVVNVNCPAEQLIVQATRFSCDGQ